MKLLAFELCPESISAHPLYKYRVIGCSGFHDVGLRNKLDKKCLIRCLIKSDTNHGAKDAGN